MRTTSSRRLAPPNPTDAEMRPPSAGGDTQMEPPRSAIAQKRTLIAIPLMQVVADSSPQTWAASRNPQQELRIQAHAHDVCGTVYRAVLDTSSMSYEGATVFSSPGITIEYMLKRIAPVVLAACLRLTAQQADVLYDEAKVPKFTLPDVLALRDGERT